MTSLGRMVNDFVTRVLPQYTCVKGQARRMMALLIDGLRFRASAPGLSRLDRLMVHAELGRDSCAITEACPSTPRI